MAEEHTLLVSFPDQSETFVLGFEAGQCWERLHHGAADEVTMHTANEEVFRRMARHFGYEASFEPSADGWATARFSRGRPKLRAVPPGPSR